MAMINIHDTFSSFEDFHSKLVSFQREQNTQFILNASEKLPQSDSLFPVFKYSVLRYVCKQGKRVHEANDGSMRPRQRSFKLGCPVQMNVRLNRPKGREPFLKVTKLHLQHENHEVSKEIFQLYPEQRRFEPDGTDEIVLGSVTMKTAEKRDILEKRHGNAVMTQDVYNKERLLLLGRGQGGTDEEKCEEFVREVMSSGGYGEVGQDDNHQFIFCCFMTAAMKSVLLKFPQCFIMDCTYKVNQYLYPLLTIMIIDGEGHGMPVFHAVLAKEDRHIMEKCLNIFAQQFNSEETSCFIVDKDMAEIAAIGTVFPGVPVNLCHFHVSQAVERYLRKELGRGVSSVKLVRDLFMSQVSTESEDEFAELKTNIMQIVPQSVIDYFETNWWAKRHLWAACCNINVVKFHATTTNAIESYHSKIKKTVNEKLSLSNTLFSILAFDESKINESRRQQIISCHSQVYDLNDRDEVRSVISQNMTRFGGDLVKSELTLSEKVNYTVADSPVEGCYDVSYKDRHHQTSAVSCSCSTYGHMKLPCRHMFTVCRHLCLQFDVNLVPQRFLASFILNGSGSGSLPVQSAAMPVLTMPSAPPSYRTAEGRYRRAKSLCDSIANFLSILGEAEFKEKLAELEGVISRWSPSVRNAGSALFGEQSSGPDPPVLGSGTIVTDEGSAEQFLPLTFGEDFFTNSLRPFPPSSTVVGDEGSAEPSLSLSSGRDFLHSSHPSFPASSTVVGVGDEGSAEPSLPLSSGRDFLHSLHSSFPASSTVVGVGDDGSTEPSLPLTSGRDFLHSSHSSFPASSTVVGVGDDGSEEPSLPLSSGRDFLHSSHSSFPASSTVVGVGDEGSAEPSLPLTSGRDFLHSSHSSFPASSTVVGVGDDGSEEPSLPLSSGRDFLHSSHPSIPASSIVVGVGDDGSEEPSLPLSSGRDFLHSSLPSFPASSNGVGDEGSVEVVLTESTSWPKMSKLLKPRGRPGTKQSFTGNYTKKKGLSLKRQRTLPLTFQCLSIEDQVLLLIRALSTHQALPDLGALIEPEYLKPYTEYGDIVMDDKVNISIVKDFVSPSAWDIIRDGVDTRRSDALFFCGLCKEVDDLELKMIQCEHCLVWFHFHCVGYSSRKKVVTWFCDSCLQ